MTYSSVLYLMLCAVLWSLWVLLCSHLGKVQEFYTHGIKQRIQLHIWYPVPFPIQHRRPHPKSFPQQCQGHSSSQFTNPIKNIYLQIASYRLTDSWESQGLSELYTYNTWIKIRLSKLLLLTFTPLRKCVIMVQVVSWINLARLLAGCCLSGANFSRSGNELKLSVKYCQNLC